MLCPKTTVLTSKNQRSKRYPTENKKFGTIPMTEIYKSLGWRPGRSELLEIGKTFQGEIMLDTDEDRTYQVAMEWIDR
jgi:hypothetical protein